MEGCTAERGTADIVLILSQERRLALRLFNKIRVTFNRLAVPNSEKVGEPHQCLSFPSN
jgi:hypothetical protein